jgi:penicillin-insensitive murein DD-endopeptidase
MPLAASHRADDDRPVLSAFARRPPRPRMNPRSLRIPSSTRRRSWRYRRRFPLRRPAPPRAPARLRALLAVVTVATALPACAPLGVISDGTSVSGGQPNRGWLLDGRRLADEGEGFFAPPTWKARGLRYGSDEMIALLSGAARQISVANAPIRLGVADISHDGGGPAYAHHRSHQNGRDADLLLYMLDAAGRPYQSHVMTPVDAAGLATDGSRHRLDVARTWQLVRALVTSAERNVQYMFLDEPLIQLLLDHARAIDEPPWLLDLARQALLEPNGAPHPDHLHVRIYCAPTDLSIGCQELGNLALLDKRLADRARWNPIAALLVNRLPAVGAGLLARRLTAPLPSPATGRP